MSHAGKILRGGGSAVQLAVFMLVFAALFGVLFAPVFTTVFMFMVHDEVEAGTRGVAPEHIQLAMAIVGALSGFVAWGMNRRD